LELFFFGSEDNVSETTMSLSQYSMQFDLKDNDCSSEHITKTKSFDFPKENLTLSQTNSFKSPTKEIAEKFSEIDFSNPQILKKKIIFHCEFSQSRGPKMYNLLRSLDREINFKHYPRLTYPDIYLLEGGYSLFQEHFPVFFEFSLK
jgi:hypothetical protein